MPDADYTALLLIIDRSGSMAAIRDDMVGGLQSLLAAQADLPGTLTVDIVTFDDEIEHQAVFADPATVQVRLEPRGMTALLDALGESLEGFRSALEALPVHARPSTVQVVVVTDGHENSSRRYTRDQVRSLIADLTAEWKWDFVYLGANQDAITVGVDLGFDADSSLTYAPAPDSVGASSDVLHRYMSDLRGGGRRGFAAEERDRVMGGDD
ncbi:MAG: VWA domain-containing protein [Actinobacteria bacterium]|nr:VWA domain-containing protein [Actinomycetota bacterium]MBU1609601.1 VWA domain-containing protein [Actinomycetota bacterium]MBU2315436.1 VWA domain-containing protein [Actinomycetota bacterium]MBU2384710.1 VWA domain-containing protein [Actinomycetota bacterium]